MPVLFYGAVYHGGGADRSDDVRDPLELARGAGAADSDAGRLGDLERATAQLRGTRD